MATSSARPYAFTSEFELALVRAALGDPALLGRIANLIRPDRLRVEEARLLITQAVEAYKSTSLPPTTPVVMNMLRQQVELGKVTRAQLDSCGLAIEQAIDLPPVDSAFIVKAVADEERRRAIWEALDESLRAVGRGDYDEVVKLVDAAGSIGQVETGPGLDFGRSLATRTATRQTGAMKARWGTGIVDLDDALRGGLAAGELGCLLAAPKSGKSTALLGVVKHAISIGGTVLYYSLEMDEESLVERLDAAISGVKIIDMRRKAEAVQINVSDFLADGGGSAIFKQFAPGSSVGELEAHMRMLRADQGIEPSMLIVDYGDLLSAEGDDRFDSLGNVYNQLRAIAINWKIPAWTASQAKREALQKKIVTSTDISESWKKVMVSDVVVAICGTEEERAAGVVRFSVAACRFAQTGTQVGPLRSDFATGRIVSDDQGGDQ